MKPHLFLPLLISFLLGVPLAAATDNGDLETRFREARGEFLKAGKGDAQALTRSMALFQSLSEQQPALSPLFSAYLGAAQTLQGRDAWLAWNKMRLTEHGLSTLDRALAKAAQGAPDTRFAGNLVQQEVRMVAARTFVAVPSAIFHRADQGCQLARALHKEASLSPDIVEGLAPLARACP